MTRHGTHSGEQPSLLRRRRLDVTGRSRSPGELARPTEGPADQVRACHPCPMCMCMSADHSMACGAWLASLESVRAQLENARLPASQHAKRHTQPRRAERRLAPEETSSKHVFVPRALVCWAPGVVVRAAASSLAPRRSAKPKASKRRGTPLLARPHPPTRPTDEGAHGDRRRGERSVEVDSARVGWVRASAQEARGVGG